MPLNSNETGALMDILEMTAPGTALREGLENVLRANTGGLIVIGDFAKIKPIMKGGFAIDTEYSPAHLYELAKMDGAIIVSQDLKRISCANTHLMPDANIPSSETGIRHRTAEQTARQTGALVICISQRRHVISLYKGSFKYILKDVSVLLNTANQALGTLEKYKDVLEEALLRLSVQEFDNVVTLPDVLQVIQRAEMFKRVEKMLRLYLTELGDESQLIRMQAEELSNNVEKDEALTIRDYMVRIKDKDEQEQLDEYMQRLARFDNEQLLDLDLLARTLNLNEYHEKDKRVVLEPRGYRILNKIARLPYTVIENMVAVFGTLQSIVLASNEDVNVLVFDTEIYSNTGGQASKATPTAAIAKFAASGKRTKKKDLGMMAMSYGYVYVAQVSLGADKNQTIKAITEAESYNGPSLIIAYAPCISHGIKKGMTNTPDEQKKAVDCGYWNLYRYNPTLKGEKNPFTLDSKEPKSDFRDFLMGEVRYAALAKVFPELAEELFAKTEKDAKERFENYKKLSQE